MWCNGCEVAILDKNPTAVRKFIDAGVKSVENAKKLAQNCELQALMFLIILCNDLLKNNLEPSIINRYTHPNI
jgi:hypothetical protein